MKQAFVLSIDIAKQTDMNRVEDQSDNIIGQKVYHLGTKGIYSFLFHTSNKSAMNTKQLILSGNNFA